jgi:hypothetical protein
MISILFTLLIMCVAFAVAWWIISVIPFPAPMAIAKTILQIIVAVIFLIWLISLLIPYAGFSHPLVR